MNTQNYIQYEKCQRTLELLVEFGLAHAIALFAEDVMSQAISPQASGIGQWQTTLVEVFDLIVQAREKTPDQDFLLHCLANHSSFSLRRSVREF